MKASSVVRGEVTNIIGIDGVGVTSECDHHYGGYYCSNLTNINTMPLFVGDVVNVKLPITEEQLEKKYKEYTGLDPKKSTLQLILLLLDRIKNDIEKKGEAEVSNELASLYVSRVGVNRGGKKQSVRILRFLCDISILRKVKDHCKEERVASKYQLLLAGEISIELQLYPSVRNKLINLSERIKSNQWRDQAYAWVKFSIDQVKVSESTVRKMEESDRNYSNSVKNVKLGNYWLSKSRNRITSIFSSFSKSARREILIDDHAVTLIDLPSSHLLILPYYLEENVLPKTKNKKSISGFKEEVRKYREIIGSEDFYEYLLPDIERTKAKNGVQVLLNRKGQRYDRDVYKAFKREFPVITGLVMKLTLKAPLGPKLQRIESRFICKRPVESLLSFQVQMR